MGLGTCPKCNGSLREPYTGEMRYVDVIAGYDKNTNTIQCHNCGGQKMFSKPSGQVPLRDDGTPCLHEFIGTKAGRSYVKYKCLHCIESYSIDSGD